MTERDFAIGDLKFKLNKLDPIRQFHIVKRCGPILSGLLPVMGKIAKSAGNQSLSEHEKFEEMGFLAQPLLEGFSKLSDKDAEKVLFSLLSSVEMQQETGNWARIADENSLFFQNLELPMLFNAAGRAFVYNLASFFPGLRKR